MSSLSYVTITGTFDDGSGTALTGAAVFTPSAAVYAAGIPLVSAATPVTANITSGSLFGSAGGALTLLATDNSGLSFESQTGFFYWTVVVTISGQVLPSWSFFLPSSPSSVDLYALANTAAGGGGDVSSVFGRTGVIVATSGDYTVSEVTGAAPLASPAFTGTPMAPTASALANDTQVATTAYADAAVAVETSRAETAEALKAPLASPALTGTPTAPTQTTGDSSTKIATDAFVTTAVATETSRAETAEALLIPLSQKGAASGVAALGSNSLVVPAQLGVVPSSPSAYSPLLYGAVWGYPWKFWLDAYGAKGDGQIVTDGAMSSSGSPTTLTCVSSAPFKSSDVSKWVHIGAAGGGAYTPLCGVQITAFISSSQVTVSAPCTSTISGAIVAWATDDSAAINAAKAAGITYAKAGSGYAEVVGWPARFGLGGTASPVNSGGYLGNALIPLPPIAGPLQKIELALVSTEDSSAFAGIGTQATPQADGFCLMCLRNDGTVDSTYGPSHVIGGPYDGYGGSTTNFSNMQLTVRGMKIIAPYNGTYGGIDLYGVGEQNIPNYGYQALAVAGTSGPYPTMADNVDGAFSNFGYYGLRMASTTNNENCNIGIYNCEGACEGIGVSEHSTWQKVGMNYCYNGMVVFSGNGGMAYAATGLYTVIGECVNGIYFGGTTDEGPYLRLFLPVLGIEGIGSDMIVDTNNYGKGVINYISPNGSTTVSGGSHLTVTNVG